MVRFWDWATLKVRQTGFPNGCERKKGLQVVTPRMALSHRIYKITRLSGRRSDI